jgi:hypothetical protein
MTGAEGLGSAAGAYFAQLSQSVTSPKGVGSLSGGEGAASLSGGEGAGGQSSASISAPGQLLSELQQLQAQDPTKFTQVVGQIASQLQTAAQQSQGGQADFLSNVAQQFQSVANGGSLTQLQGHNHDHRVPATYASGGSGASQSLAGAAPQGSASTASGSSVQQLFASISSEVSQALAG